jgi:hypothetical protein
MPELTNASNGTADCSPTNPGNNFQPACY